RATVEPLALVAVIERHDVVVQLPMALRSRRGRMLFDPVASRNHASTIAERQHEYVRLREPLTVDVLFMRLYNEVVGNVIALQDRHGAYVLEVTSPLRRDVDRVQRHD